MPAHLQWEPPPEPLAVTIDAPDVEAGREQLELLMEALEQGQHG